MTDHAESTPTRRWLHLLGAVAAAIVVLVMLTPLMRQEQQSPAVDEPGLPTLESRIAGPIARDACVLRWSPLAEGTLYTLELTAEDSSVLHRADNLDASEYHVPETILSDLASGAAFFWQVEARLADGTLVPSPLFRAELE